MRSDPLEEIATILARGLLRHHNRRKLQVSEPGIGDNSLASTPEQSVHVSAVG